MSNLELHHQQFRSHSGDDSAENLITLCITCHASVHNRGTVATMTTAFRQARSICDCDHTCVVEDRDEHHEKRAAATHILLSFADATSPLP
jgi:hypothetical protein